MYFFLLFCVYITNKLFVDKQVTGLFVPKTFRSQERNTNFGRFVPWTFRSLDDSFLGCFVPRMFRSHILAKYRYANLGQGG